MDFATKRDHLGNWYSAKDTRHKLALSVGYCDKK